MISFAVYGSLCASLRVVYTRQRRLSAMTLCLLYSCTLPEDSNKRSQVHSTVSSLALLAFGHVRCELQTESFVPRTDQDATAKWTVLLSCVLFPAGSGT